MVPHVHALLLRVNVGLFLIRFFNFPNQEKGT